MPNLPTSCGMSCSPGAKLQGWHPTCRVVLETKIMKPPRHARHTPAHVFMYQSSIYSICTLALVHRYLNMWNIIYIYICTVYIYTHVYGYKRILCIVNTLLIITTQAYINTQYSTCCIERSSQESHFVPLIAALELPPCHFTPPT